MAPRGQWMKQPSFVGKTVGVCATGNRPNLAINKSFEAPCLSQNHGIEFPLEKSSKLSEENRVKHRFFLKQDRVR